MAILYLFNEIVFAHNSKNPVFTLCITHICPHQLYLVSMFLDITSPQPVLDSHPEDLPKCWVQLDKQYDSCTKINTVY